MAKRESFLLRTDPATLDAIRLWAKDDLRSVNAQIEFLLRRVLREEGRLGSKSRLSGGESGQVGDETQGGDRSS